MEAKGMVKVNAHQQGFTLIELLVTISVLIIMLVVGVPSFSNLIDSNKLRTTRDLLVTAIHTGQQQASSKNVPVYLCPSSDSTSCDSAWNNGDGWILYEDLNRDDALSSGETFLVQNDVKIDNILSKDDDGNNSSQLIFSPTGHITANTFIICSTLDDQDDLQFSTSRSGRIVYGTSGDLCSE